MQAAVGSKWSGKFHRDMAIAKVKADKFNLAAPKYAPAAIDPKILLLLKKEFPSVEQVFHRIVMFAFQYPTDYITTRNGRDEVVMIKEPGGRRWGQRVLAACCELAPSTIQRALKRLCELGLIWMDTSRKWGTYIFVEGFERMSRALARRAEVRAARKKVPSRAPMEGAFSLRSGPSGPKSHSLTDLVDVPDRETGKKYKIGGTLETANALLAKIRAYNRRETR